MMSDGSCPDRQRLADYVAGMLPDDVAESVNGHIRACRDCQSTLLTLEKGGDTRRLDAAPARPLPDMSSHGTDELGHLAEYNLLGKLGQGGMGVVYKALHTELDRIVALKLLPPGLVNDEQAVARFKREIKAVGRLDHANIVRAYDARECDGRHFLVMELVTGVDLADLIRLLGPLPIADACELIRQAATGLDYAHRHGLVHRDIKPSNLIVSNTGVVKILDLGLARFWSLPTSEGEVTVSGQALGTPDYMAPEQVQDSHTADIRADLYSLGCTLYFLLTSRPPFSGPAYRSAYDKMSGHVRDAVKPVTGFRNDVPERLAEVLEKTLAKDPDERFSTPAELVEGLAPLARKSNLRALVAESQGRSPTPRGLSQTTPIVPLRVASRPRKRLRVIACSLGALALILLAVIMGGQFRSGTKPIAEPVPEVPAEVEQEDQEPAGWIVMSWTLRGTGKPNLWLFDPLGRQRIQLTDDPQSFDSHPSFSPDGRRIAFIRGVRFDQPTSLWVCSVDGTEQRKVVAPTSPTERFLSPSWLSDSELCYARDPLLDRRPDMELWRVGVDQGQPQRMFRFADVLGGENGVVTDVSPDSRQLAVAAQSSWLWPSSNVHITDLQGELVETLWQDDPDDRKDARVLWSGDGNSIAWHHNFTRGGLASEFYYGVGLAQREVDGSWNCRLQSNRELLATPLAWSPSSPHLLCAHMSDDGDRATLVLMDRQFQIVRELFELDTYGWQPGQRDFGRLADWGIVPDDIPLPARE